MTSRAVKNMASREKLQSSVGMIPEFGSCQQVASGVWWLRMPLPFVLDHVNLWLLEDDDGWTLFDCGLATEAVKILWEQLFDGFLREQPLRRVVVSHNHPDHLGLADWLLKRYGGQLWMSAGEYQAATAVYSGAAGWQRQDSESFLRRCGVPEDQVRLSAHDPSFYRWGVPAIPTEYLRLEHEMQLQIKGRSWQVLTGRGHAPEQICLYCRELGLLISSDQVLEQITSNVSVWPDAQDADPLSLYFDSLVDFAVLPHDILVLPSHGRPFYGLHRRLRNLKEHHQIRLNQLRHACRNSATVYELLPVLFERSLDDQQLHYAVGEALAHLNYLLLKGELSRQMNSAGQWLFKQGVDSGNSHHG